MPTPRNSIQKYLNKKNALGHGGSRGNGKHLKNKDVRSIEHLHRQVTAVERKKRG